MKIVVLKFEEIASTNDEAARQAKLGAAEGVCVTARAQTAGRGRHGRIWHSPKDAGLYFSMILRPKFAKERWTLITLLAGVAVHRTIADTAGSVCDIKWVNDILFDERKLGGILAETCETADGTAVILGIGINLARTAFPPELAPFSIALQDIATREFSAEIMLQTLTRHLQNYYEKLSCAEASAEIIDEWTQRSSYAFGKTVKIAASDETIIGTTQGLAENGALRLMMPDGTPRVIQSGEVFRLRTA